MFLKAGTRAPEFKSVDQFGVETSLQALLKEGPVVLYFYPRDFTYVCTKQACAFRDEHEVLTFAGAIVCGVSSSRAQVQRAFSDVHNIPFPLISDTEGSIAKAYGSARMMGLTRRATFVIDQDGMIQSVHHHELQIRRHLDGVRKSLEGLNLRLDDARMLRSGS